MRLYVLECVALMNASKVTTKQSKRMRERRKKETTTKNQKKKRVYSIPRMGERAKERKKAEEKGKKGRRVVGCVGHVMLLWMG